MPEKLLSICICTIPQRKSDFDYLLIILKHQIKNSRHPEGFEILFDASPRGTLTIGAKREKMKRLAIGKYICYIDDDDVIRENYIDLLIEGMFYNCDIVSFGCDYYRDGKFVQTTFFNRFLDAENKESQRKVTTIGEPFNTTRVWYACGSAFHLMPVKRELALQVEFIDANDNEDHLYSEGLKPLLQSEFHIPHAIYKVNHKTK